MDWYYKDGDIRVGPVSDAQMRELAWQGTITPKTMVWNELLAKWRPYSEIAEAAGLPSSAVQSQPEEETKEGDSWGPYAGAVDTSNHADSYETPPASEQKLEAYCSQCFNKFLTETMVRYGDAYICAACKPLFFQKLKEGAETAGILRYAGFWVRFVAKFIDNTIVGIIATLFYGAAFFMFFPDDGMMITPARMMAFSLVYLLQISFSISYATFFVGKYGATPGKMALNLEVVNPDGSKVGYAKAFGRFFAEIISGIILAIGYIMAAFDNEKRALHDRICSTRVIRKSA